MCQADPNRVRQILTNLLHNAIKFTENRSISIESDMVGGGSRFIRITIADTGCGMSPEAHQTNLHAALPSGPPIGGRATGSGVRVVYLQRNS